MDRSFRHDPATPVFGDMKLIRPQAIFTRAGRPHFLTIVTS
jgi:hypothetical protein